MSGPFDWITQNIGKYIVGGGRVDRELPEPERPDPPALTPPMVIRSSSAGSGNKWVLKAVFAAIGGFVLGAIAYLLWMRLAG